MLDSILHDMLMTHYHINKVANTHPCMVVWMGCIDLCLLANLSHVTNMCLLALSVGQRLCANFYVSRANFLTTLRSHLDVTCSCYLWSSSFNVDDESLHTLDN